MYTWQKLSCDEILCHAKIANFFPKSMCRLLLHVRWCTNYLCASLEPRIRLKQKFRIVVVMFEQNICVKAFTRYAEGLSDMTYF
jgi:hypothetical protein